MTDELFYSGSFSSVLHFGLLLCQNRFKLPHVLHGQFDSQQLLEENQREGQIDDVVVVDSQATQNAKQEVSLLLHFWLFNDRDTTNSHI